MLYSNSGGSNTYYYYFNNEFDFENDSDYILKDQNGPLNISQVLVIGIYELEQNPQFVKIRVRANGEIKEYFVNQMDLIKSAIRGGHFTTVTYRNEITCYVINFDYVPFSVTEGKFCTY